MYTFSVAVLQHTRLLMANQYECYSHCVNPPSVAANAVTCTICKTFQTQVVSWARLNTTSVPRTHPPYNDSSCVGTGMWSLDAICYNVFRSQEVVEGLLDLQKRLAKAHCVNDVTSLSRGPVVVHQHGEPNVAVEGDLFQASTINSASAILYVNPRIEAPSTAHQALSMGYQYAGEELKTVGQKTDPIRCTW
jgi:hypothetical protein